MKNRKNFLLMLMMVLMLAGCAQDAEPGAQPDTQVSEQENQADTQITEQGTATTENSESGEEPYILTFEAKTTEGEYMTSECFADSRLTMINVWATYCNPCLVEMPDLGTIAASYDPAEFQMIGIVSDVAEESEAADIDYAKELIAQTGADYPHLLLNQSLYSNLVGAVEAVPTTFFVNQKGELLGYAVGANSKEGWEEIINELLAESE